MHAKPPPAVTALPHVEPPSLLASVGERENERWSCGRRKERKKGERKKRKKKRKEKRKKEKENINDLFAFIKCDL
jgi:hypothetical protein